MAANFFISAWVKTFIFSLQLAAHFLFLTSGLSCGLRFQTLSLRLFQVLFLLWVGLEAEILPVNHRNPSLQATLLSLSFDGLEFQILFSQL
jgi:hypothetical protein